MNSKELANKMVNNFINNFRETFGVKPKVFYNINYNIPTLNEIFDCVNEQYKLIEPNGSIENKSRDGIVILYRSIYYKIAKDFGYSLSSIGSLTSQDHSTVLHGLKKVKDNSPLKIKILETISKL